MNFQKVFTAILIFFLSPVVLAQPYIFYSQTDTLDSREIQIIKSFDISTGIYTTLNNMSDDYAYPVWDPSQSFLAIKYHGDYLNIYDCSDTSKHELLIRGTIDKLLYAKNKNRLYFFMEDLRQPEPYYIDVFDLSSDSLITTIPITGDVWENQLIVPNFNAFFSRDKSKIYFYSIDSLTENYQVGIFSLNSNEITRKINLSEIGYPNANSYRMLYGKEGKGLIESTFRNGSERYFNIFDFDSGKKSAIVKYLKKSYGFFVKDGEYLITCNLKDTIDAELLDGKMAIIEISTGNILKQMNYPPGGHIYLFNNYPDNFYYALNLDSDPIVYTVNVDSILSELKRK